MIRNALPPVLILALSMVACTSQAATLAPSLPAGNTLPAKTLAPATTVPSFTLTPIPSSSETPVPPALPVVASPALARISFQDENDGWGLAVNDTGYVLRTVDGGRTWLNASPPGMGAIGLSASLAVLNTNTAWLLEPGTDFFAGTLYRTSDGGITWSSNPVPFGEALMQFQDGSSGRAMAERGAAAGSEAVELFQTSDGGATWVSVFHDDPTQSGYSDSLPLAGIKNGMTFLNASTGWVTGSIPRNGEVYLYVTHDGGASWSQQGLPLPTGYDTYQYLPQAPVFFGKDGFLPLTIYRPDTNDFILYTTHDGGTTWTGDPTNANGVIRPGLPAFADALHGWCWDGGTNLYSTSDGARSWVVSKSSLDLSGNLFELKFVPGPAGLFTGWALSGLDSAGRSQLYRTTDGLTWTPLIP